MIKLPSCDIILTNTNSYGQERRILIDFLKNLIKEAGRLCLEKQDSLTAADVEFKNSKDLVTRIDKAVEAFIIDAVRDQFPDHDIFGEETGRSESGSDTLWVIDPIDGTTSFLHGQPFYSVSIAIYQNKFPIAGTVYLPVFNELFHAEAGKGAFLNDAPITVSETGEMIHSVLATGFACLRAGKTNNNLDRFNRIVPHIRDIRRYGSAAIDLCYVACGRLEGYWEMNLNLYDIAAGAFIVREAGGIVTDFSGGSAYPEQGIIATAPGIEKELMSFFDSDPMPGEREEPK